MTRSTMTSRTALPAAHDPPRLADDALFALAPGAEGLAEGDATWIKRWVSDWLPHAPDALVVMGCVGMQARAARLSALRQVRDALVGCGVPAARIRYTGDALGAPVVFAPQAGLTPPEPLAAAWLKVVRARDAELSMRSIRSLFERATHPRRPACTGAS